MWRHLQVATRSQVFEKEFEEEHYNNPTVLWETEQIVASYLLKVGSRSPFAKTQPICRSGKTQYNTKSDIHLLYAGETL